ncbi:MAG: PilZ domain-containing protein [Candidatus Omnitrophota bacterium]
MMSWDGLNRRKFPRVNFPCLVVIKYDQGERETLLTHTENIGSGGICVILKKGIKMFTPVEFEMDLLDAQEHLRMKGKVVWSIRRKQDEKKKPLFYDTGIEFVDCSEKEKKRLEETVEKLVGKGAPFSLP